MWKQYGGPWRKCRGTNHHTRCCRILFISAQEELCQVLLVVPDCVKLGREPDSKAGVENMQLLLLLLLGCAVQCPNKETFIDRIKQLDVQVQHAIVDCIKQVSLSYSVHHSESVLIEFMLCFLNCYNLKLESILSPVIAIIYT
jgi:hypothetical protein